MTPDTNVPDDELEGPDPLPSEASEFTEADPDHIPPDEGDGTADDHPEIHP